MITSEYNLVELIAEENKWLCDIEKTSTFKKVICKKENVDKFIEITEDEALEIQNKHLDETEEEG